MCGSSPHREFSHVIVVERLFDPHAREIREAFEIRMIGMSTCVSDTSVSLLNKEASFLGES